MPYRRLPNTDQARIRSMERATEMEYSETKATLAISYKIINETRSFLTRFVKAHDEYTTCYNRQVAASKKYITLAKNARLYVSHFIQVLNLAVIRGEIKKEALAYYGLEDENMALPDLTSDATLIEWGEKVVMGEDKRKKNGGAPIYNPTIAKVNVHLEMFKESYHSQKKFQESTTRSLQAVASQREEADRLILEIWNQVESYYADYPASKKIEACKQYGVIYYYRKSEKERIRQERLQQKLSFE